MPFFLYPFSIFGGISSTKDCLKSIMSFQFTIGMVSMPIPLSLLAKSRTSVAPIITFFGSQPLNAQVPP